MIGIAELPEFVCDRIKDPKIREIVFNRAYPKARGLSMDLVGNVLRLINFSFVYMYAIYLHERFHDSSKLITNSRVYNSFETVFVNQPINLDQALFVLSELQITFEQDSLNSKIYMNNKIDFQEWKEIINAYYLSIRLVDNIANFDERLSMFVKTVESLPFLKYLKLVEC